jgi:hypothetical protein
VTKLGSYDRLAWLFVAVFVLHNFEEGLFLPGFLASAPLIHYPAGPTEFRFALVVLTASSPVLAWLSVRGNRAATIIHCGYALAMALNVFVPHLIGAIALRTYVPGVITAVILVLPVSLLMLRQAVREARLDLRAFAWAGPLTVLAMAVSIPVLFALGRLLLGG